MLIWSRSLRDYTDDATVMPCRRGGHDRGGGYILLSVNPATADNMPLNPPLTLSSVAVHWVAGKEWWAMAYHDVWPPGRGFFRVGYAVSYQSTL